MPEPIALLIFDDRAKAATTILIKDAAKQFKRKFGFYPNVCYIHPKRSFESPVTIGKRASITVEHRPFVLRHHFQVQGDTKESEK